jgi:hypothetical protein
MFASTHSKPQYLKFAARCDHLAALATMEIERAEYRTRAALWRQLARAPLAADGMHFTPRMMNEDGEKTMAGHEPAGDSARTGAVRQRSRIKIKLVRRTAWTKRNKSGQFMAVKKSKKKSKGARQEKAR